MDKLELTERSLEGYLDSPRFIADRERMRQRYIVLDGAAPPDEELRRELIKDFCITLEFGEIEKETEKDWKNEYVQDYN
jgi:hypothetical protein